MQQLRDYQHDAIDQAVKALHHQKHPLIVCPTGSGKTTIGVHLFKDLLYAGNRVCWIAHREELIDQAIDRFKSERITVGAIKAGREPNEGAQVQVASVQTLARRETTDFDIYLIDEAHRAVAESYRRVLPKHALVVGLTATPYRLDGMGLGSLFTRLVEGPTVRQLIAEGYLVEPQVWVVKPPNMDGVTKRGGDFATGESERIVNTPDQRASIVGEWQKRMSDKRTLVFAASIAHSKEIVEAFRIAGVSAEHLDGETPRDERKAITQRFREGKTQLLSNVQLFTEGFDLPEIEGLILARPTASLAMHMQMMGRVMRPTGGAIVHDHVGNNVRLGVVTQNFDYNLDAGQRVARGGDPGPGLSLCEGCYMLFDRKLDECPHCGEPRSKAQNIEEIGLDGVAEMKPLSENAQKEQRYNQICEEAAGYGWKDTAIRAKFREEFGEWPAEALLYKDEEDEEGYFVYVNPETATREIKAGYYRALLALALDKGFKIGFASHRYKELIGKWPSGFVAEVKAEFGLEEEAKTNVLKNIWKT